MHLQTIFNELVAKYNPPEKLFDELWIEILDHYNESHRHYHNLKHIEDLIAKSIELKDHFEDYEAILFSIFYHDIIYNACKKNNEAKSADLAAERMRSIGVSEEKVKKVVLQINATKNHQPSDQPDTNLLLDLDLSILGANAEQYSRYTQNVRKEYAIYPDFLYKPGRRKVINSFLNMDNIFQTTIMRKKYETQARKNLMQELENL